MKKIFLPLMLFLGTSLTSLAQVSNVTTQFGANIYTSTDDYITFKLLATPPTPFYQDPFTYTLTATQNGNPITVTTTTGVTADNIPYWNAAQPFRTAAGTAGKGPITLTVTPNWGNFTPVQFTVNDPGIYPVATCGTAKTVTYNLMCPYSYTEASLTNGALYIPKFDQSNGQTLTKVELSYSGDVFSTLFIENFVTTAETARAKCMSIVDFSLNGTIITGDGLQKTIISTPGYPSSVNLSAAVLVPASGTWPGDIVAGNGDYSTILAMSPWLEPYILLGYTNYKSDPRWVENAVSPTPTVAGSLLTDALILPLSKYTLSDNKTYTSATDLGQFIGTGTIPFNMGTETGLLSSIQGGLNMTNQATGFSYWLTVTYTYTDPCQSVSGRVYNDQTVGANVGSGTTFSTANPAPALYVYLLNSDGNIIAKIPVNADGTWGTSTSANNYTAILSSDGSGTIGGLPPSSSITSTGWNHTAQYNGAPNTATDGTNDGKSQQFTVPAGGNATNINFGIYKTPLAVNFGSIMAKIVNGNLVVNWQTLVEENNSRFDVEVSKDGSHFVKAGEIATKALDGKSTQTLSYTFSTPLTNAMSLAGLSLMALGIIGLGGNRRKRLILFGMIALMGLGFFGVSCNKYNDVNANDITGKMFIRIAQVDKDGSTKYSKTVQVISE